MAVSNNFAADGSVLVSRKAVDVWDYSFCGHWALCGHDIAGFFLPEPNGAAGDAFCLCAGIAAFRRPQIGQVLVRSLLDRTIFVLGRAMTAAAPAGAIIWLLQRIPVGDGTLLTQIAMFLEPLGGLMGLSGPILMAFLLGAACQ